jgi:galactokinase/mevalonate kinase-like predicted kinase
MVDNKSRDDSSIIGSSSATHIFDTARENFVRAADHIASVQPQYAQAFSNLQLDYIQTAKNVIENTISAQKQLIENFNIISVSTPYTEQFTRQSNEITNNTLRAVDINNKLATNTVDAARENLKVCSRAADAVTEFSNNIAKACTVFSVPEQQQQLYHSLEK